MKNLLITFLVAFGFAAPSLAHSQKSDSKSKKIGLALSQPFAAITQGVLSIPGGLVGGFEGSIKSDDKGNNRVLHGVFYGVAGIVHSAVKLITSPVTIPIKIGRVLGNKDVNLPCKKSILFSYYAARDGMEESYNY